ncbi:hypothetical protein, partial [Peribacillus frigoritolerans]|uniref:hypothetical protein n=1 Tax=Peribacillus frigoritolerans TaxID=450367 RepID=UPI0032E3708F
MFWVSCSGISFDESYVFRPTFVYSLFSGLYNLDVDFRFRHSLSAGGPGASSTLRACGVSPGHAF